MTNFVAYKHPVIAVMCPLCKARAGVWCKRPSEHKACDLHAERKKEADEVFIKQHGVLASIDRMQDGWSINLQGRIDRKEQLELSI